MIPIGVFANVLAVAAGGLLGALLKERLSAAFKEELNLVFGVCAMTIGIQAILLMVNMPAVIFASILGTVAGIALHLEQRIAKTAQTALSRLVPADASGNTPLLVTAVVLFCSSGTGVYGAMISGMTGDHSVLIAKSILDVFTAMIFACSLGVSVSLIAIPQLAIFLLLFYGARLIYPLATPGMIGDFRACGGVIMLATGFRIAGIKPFPIADMLPSMLLVMPLSWLWSLFA